MYGVMSESPRSTKSLRVSIMNCDTMVNTQTQGQLLTSYTNSSDNSADYQNEIARWCNGLEIGQAAKRS